MEEAHFVRPDDDRRRWEEVIVACLVPRLKPWSCTVEIESVKVGAV